MKTPAASRWRLPARILSRQLVLALLAAIAATTFSSCQREEKVAPAPVADSAAADLAEARRKLSVAQDSLAATQEQLAATTASLRAANHEVAEKEQVVTQSELKLRTASAELEALKKSEALVFADICSQQQQGQNVIALARFQRFITDFPRSPLAGQAAKAITDLTEETARETQQREERMDPKRQEYVMKRLLDDGLLTLQELAPMLKNRTRPQVQSLLGKPNRIFPDGTEIGYIDRVTSSSGPPRKGMLIVTFDASVVSALRMDYAGPKVVP